MEDNTLVTLGLQDIYTTIGPILTLKLGQPVKLLKERKIMKSMLLLL
jgi:hypothetical protein